MSFMDDYWARNTIVGRFGISYLDKELLGISKSDLVIIGARSGCVDGETEFFTGTRWKKISEYEKGDLVLQADLQTKKATLVEPLEYIKAPCDKWYVFKTKYGIDMKLSAEHEMIYKTCRGNYTKATAEEIYNRHINSTYGFNQTFPTCFDYSGPGINLTDEQIKLMLAVMADGSFVKGCGTSRCIIHIKKPEKQAELRSILDSCGIHYNWYVRKSGGYVDAAFLAPRKEKVFSEYWYSCNKHQLQLICDNVTKWDGSVSPKGGRRFFTTVKESADFIQFAFSACGYKATIKTKDRRGRIRKVNSKDYVTKSIDYTVIITNRTEIGIKSNTTKTCWIEPTTDYKYCFTVPSHCLVLRRNGHVFVTGNSGKSSLARIIYETNNPLTTALFSLENFDGDLMAEQVRKRYNDLARTWYNSREWQTGEVQPIREIFEAIEKELEPLQQKGMIFGRQTPDGQPWTIETLKQWMVNCVTSQGINLIILDHIDYLDRDNPNESDNSHITELMKMIREVQEAAPDGCGVVAFSHLRKPIGKVEDVKVPNENEFIGSSNKIKQATQVVMIAPTNEPNTGSGYGTWFCIRKNRNGGIKNQAAKLFFDPITASYHKEYVLYNINYSGTKAEPVTQDIDIF